ncbi:C6 transcription factor [Aspergillus sp. HF37]|nr:C6 transcription factor [Aspergillus sp. HF37]
MARESVSTPCLSIRACKVRCSGGSPCFRCASKGLACRYGYQNRAGKPKGSKNRKTLESAHQLQMEWLATQFRNDDRDACGLDRPLDSRPESGALSVQSPFPDRSASPRESPPPRTSSATAGPQDSDAWKMDWSATSLLADEYWPASLSGLATPLPFANKDDGDAQQSINQPEPPHPALELIAPGVDALGTGYLCDCVRTQTINVAKLHQLTSSDVSDRFDLALKFTASALDTCNRFAHCASCGKVLSTLLLMLSAFDLAFRLLEHLVVGELPRDDRRPVLCSLGDYKVSQEEGKAIHSFLLKMTLSKGKQALEALQDIVDGGETATAIVDPELEHGGATKSSKTLSSVDRDYFAQLFNRNKTTVDMLMVSVVV